MDGFPGQWIMEVVRGRDMDGIYFIVLEHIRRIAVRLRDVKLLCSSISLRLTVR
jgi:hypothetical protein